MIDLSVVGPAIVLGLAMIGSAIGCGIAGAIDGLSQCCQIIDCVILIANNMTVVGALLSDALPYRSLPWGHIP